MSFAPSLAFAFEIRAQIAPTLHVGHGDGERTEFTPIVGGTVTRPRLSGTVLPEGATGTAPAARCATWTRAG
ncbi:Protein of unknown function [Nonomuraea pusilla]|uniref:Uncharacterized protein n=1 Tax=Nonomuraea pusilla TaxID=46177 RepID=A0A1H8G1U0_9ACTN|nr:DUF3237 family protein [Nonomuraea pusilla]SEN37298.1 Protein of unknown function [Nonomuraea pusilla]